MSQLSLTLFGGFTAVTPTGASPHFPTDKARALLAYLALTPDSPLRREALAGLFWPEQPEELARQNLRQTLSRLRKSLDQAQPGLGDGLLTVTRQTVELHGQYGTADVTSFWEQVTAVKTHPHVTLPACSVCLVRLETAVALYRRGDFLAGLSLPDALPFEEWMLLQRERLYQRQLTALNQLAVAYEQQKAFDAAYRYALWQLEMEPWREEAHRQAMRLLACDGQRSNALAQYESCRKILKEELGIEPAPETDQLWQQIKGGAFLPAGTRRTQTHHFPNPLTPFVGREEELAKILALLGDKECRVLSLIGPGGMGKTRLGVQVGRTLAQGSSVSDESGRSPAGMPIYRDGAFFIPLTAVTDSDLLVTAVAQAVGLQLAEHIPPHQQLLSYLQDKEMLLVGDSFEQVDGGAALIARVVAAAPQVQLLLTSQQPLNIQAERRFAVGGLEYAAQGETSAAVQFFLGSARRVRPDFQPAAADMPALLELCQLLDGMPLALEIAAGWVRLMDCPTILRETQKSLDFLVSPLGDMPTQRQSVRAVLAQSWQLLPLHLQGALRRMALFARGFTLEAALAVLPDVSMTDMAALLDKSLLAWRADGRYHMHQLLRAFVRQQLQPSAQATEETLFRQNYCRYYLRFVAEQEAELGGPNPQQAIAIIQRDLDNIRQAWQWALAGQMAAVLAQALSGLGRFYHLVGLFEEAEQQLLAALALVADWEESAETAVTRAQLDLLVELHLQTSHFLGQSGQYQIAILQAQSAQALAGQLDQADLLAQAYSLEGEWQRHLSQFEQARQCLDTAVTLYPTPSRNRGYARTLNQIGHIYLIQSQYEAALSAFSQARQIYESLGDQTEMSTSLGNMAEVYRLKADYQQALACSQQALAVAEAIGYQQAIVRNSIVLGTVQMDQGETALAHATYQNALTVARALGYVQGIINCHICLGVICLAQSKLAEAEQWLQMARLQAEEVGLPDLIARAAGKQGIVYVHRGEYETAVIVYEEAIQLWRLLNNQAELSLSLGNLGNIYLRLGEYERALDYFERALTAVQSVGARQVAANMMLRLGNVYKRTGSYERAIACFEHALQTFQALPHKSGMANSLGWLGVMHNEMGQYAAAQARYEQAMAISEEIGDHITMCIWLMNRAETAMYRGQYELAEELGQQAVDLCRSLGSTRYLPGALVHQAEIFFAHGKYEQCRLVLAEALPLSAPVGDQKLEFDGRLLQARLFDQFGERPTAVNHLRAMITDFAGDDYQAQIHYYLWQIGEGEAARQTAVRLYEELLTRMPNYKLQQQLKELRISARP
ncbi:MAG: tetratricopeptide repeat protein [Anaerolineae bacterium]|nr:tetratricopeptide repeat protein [Anaerolineae bacterium]